MGNRAAVVFASEDERSISPVVYLHWNGGPESIYAFLDELDRRQVRADQDYECARFCHLVGDFLDVDELTSFSLGIMNGPSQITAEALNPYQMADDNGVYVVYRKAEKEGVLGVSSSQFSRRVRRFVLENFNGPFIELSEDEVTKEKEDAYKHKYNTGDDTIASAFKRITKGKKIQGG